MGIPSESGRHLLSGQVDFSTGSMHAHQMLLIAEMSFCVLFVWGTQDALGERVGYSFSGNFIEPVWSGNGTPPTQNNVFGVAFPFTAPFTGSLSFDTTVTETVPFAGSKDYKQSIQGGFKFNVFDAVNGPIALQLAANVYVMRVTNDFTPAGAPAASDLLSVEFNTQLDPSLPSILKNGVAYTRKPVLITAPISWDWEKFNEPNDPQLRASLDMNDFFPYQGTMFAQGIATFVITSFARIIPAAGDYNIDGIIDAADYLEWRKAYGETSPDFSHADGNQDGIINGADFVIWRHALVQQNFGAGAALVPEPSIPILTAIGLLSLIGSRQRRLLCR